MLILSIEVGFRNWKMMDGNIMFSSLWFYVAYLNIRVKEKLTHGSVSMRPSIKTIPNLQDKASSFFKVWILIMRTVQLSYLNVIYTLP